MGRGWLQVRRSRGNSVPRAPDETSPAVFISYRRSDAAEVVRLIHAGYCRLYSPRSIFLDTSNIRAGASFPDLLRDRVRGAAVVLVVIGPNWQVERLREKADWVRQEIRLALQSGARVIPVLVGGASLPKKKGLPADIRRLVSRHCATLAPPTFELDLQTLLNDIGIDVGGVSELNAWVERSLFDSDIGTTIFRQVQQGAKPPESLAVYGSKAGWYNAELNALILDRSLKGEPVAFRLLPDIWLAHGSDSDEARKRFAIERKLMAGAFISNDRKIRLASDFNSPLVEPIFVQETDYLSSLMTDQMAFVQVRRDATILYHGTNGFLEANEDKARLLPLGRSAMSNQIGASTLAFTRDGHLIFVQQTATNAQSGGTLAPSGSGSLDLADLDHAGADFLGAVRYGAARELIEECGLHDRLDPATFARRHIHVFGFVRMLHRGGKPEFFCVARLPFTSQEVHAAMPTRHERRFTEHSESADATQMDVNGNIRAEVIRVCTHFSRAAIDEIDPQRLKLSYPLHHALDLLAETVATANPQAQQLVDFLEGGLRSPIGGSSE
jgi:hypothetical protein